MNKFYLYKRGEKFIKVSKRLEIGLIDNIDNAAFWTSKKNANSWKKTIEYKYPDAILVEAGLKIKK